MSQEVAIDTGNGEDAITINGNMNRETDIATGAGDDTLNISGHVDHEVSIDMGSGDDSVTIGGNINRGSDIDLGSGNDTLSIGRHINGTIDFGEGIDTLVVTESTINFENISDTINGVEQIDLTGSGTHNIALNLEDVLDMTAENDAHSLRILGTEADNVELDQEAWNQGESEEEGFTTYTANDDPTVTLQIQNDVNVGEL